MTRLASERSAGFRADTDCLPQGADVRLRLWKRPTSNDVSVRLAALQTIPDRAGRNLLPLVGSVARDEKPDRNIDSAIETTPDSTQSVRSKRCLEQLMSRKVDPALSLGCRLLHGSRRCWT